VPVGFLKFFFRVSLVSVRAFRVQNSAFGPLKRVPVIGTNFKIRELFIEKKTLLNIRKTVNPPKTKNGF
jgi:hypothetical protein